jgi:hypothetical protein
MSPGFRKFVSVFGGLLIAGLVTCLPWSYRNRIPSDADTFFWMTSILWAPTFLILGVAAGICFGIAMWPRKPSLPPSAGPPDVNSDRSSFEA